MTSVAALAARSTRATPPRTNIFFPTGEDFESMKLESTRIIDIEKFVPRESIDRLY